MAFCIGCGQHVGQGDWARGASQWCHGCEQRLRPFMDQFTAAFGNAAHDAVFSEQEWGYLQALAKSFGVAWSEALRLVRSEGLQLLDRILTIAAADGVISDAEVKYFHDVRGFLEIHESEASWLIERLCYLRALTDVREGRLPVVQSPRGVHLESDEICNLIMPATHHRTSQHRIARLDGRILATDRKLYFLSLEGGVSIAWSQIVAMNRSGPGINLELSKRAGSGYYQVPDPVWAEAILETRVRLDKRQLLVPNCDADPRRVPQHVRNEVWQRDQGRCVQCQAAGQGAWLEFDHVIPVAKGGAGTAQNLQLLCRRCNMDKRDRI